MRQEIRSTRTARIGERGMAIPQQVRAIDRRAIYRLDQGHSCYRGIFYTDPKAEKPRPQVIDLGEYQEASTQPLTALLMEKSHICGN